MEKYFKFYENNNIEDLLTIISKIHDSIKNLVDTKKARTKGVDFDYITFLTNAKLLEEGMDAESFITNFSRMFQNNLRPGSKLNLVNVRPPVPIIALAIMLYTSLYNPNFGHGESAGLLNFSELEVIKILSELVDWNWKESGGLFTFGGKGTNLYACKIGANKNIKNLKHNGTKGENFFIIMSEKGHPSQLQAANWLNLGEDNCFKIKTNSDGEMDTDIFEKVCIDQLKKGKKLLTIFLNGGTTIEHSIDPIKKIYDIREKLIKNFNLDYIPHIHVDSVMGWCWLFFKKYNFDLNPLKMDENDKLKIKRVYNKLAEIRYADSFGVDFHKTGFCPYVSSVFMVKNKKDLYDIESVKNLEKDELTPKSYSPFEYSLELSRSCIGPITAWTNIKIFGEKGFQKILYNIFNVSQYMRKKLTNEFEVLNDKNGMFATLCLVKPSYLSNLSIKEIDKLSKDEQSSLVDYNLKFFKYTKQALNENKIDFEVGFAKNYTQSYLSFKIGVLRIWNINPNTKYEDIDIFIKQLREIKKEFDKLDFNKIFLEKEIYQPKDLVYNN